MSETDFNECPKCKQIAATSEPLADGNNRFYCTQCDFEIIQEKQSRDKAQAKLESIKAQLFGGK